MAHKLSIVIVNFNVKHFLEQALISVEKAIVQLDTEVWVVDNNSVDGSVGMVQEKFPWVKLIANTENTGFSRANNQAMRKSRSEYILLLNPDTVLQEDSLVRCLDYFDRHEKAGALGVRMIDGKGKFLPESKRGLPTPRVALYKMLGLSALFPKSRVFGRYHLQYLSENETHTVDVLAGAFMMIRSAVLEQVGLLDETYFMYGEDVDLSYRITLAGFQNIYFSGTTIIHYKGESTKRKSANYVKMFYNAMVLFARKHYSSSMAGWFALFIRSAIYLRAGMAFFSRLAERIWLPLFDGIVIFLGYFGIAKYWELYHKFVKGYYPIEFYTAHVPVYIGVILVSVFLSGGYDKPVVGRRLFRGVFAGAIFLFAVYGFLPKELQFSRAILALGSVWAAISVFFIRMLAQASTMVNIRFDHGGRRKVILVGGNEENRRIENLLKLGRVNHELLGWVWPGKKRERGYIGQLDQLPEVLEIYKPDLVIFSGKDVAAAIIMAHMIDFQSLSVQVKIAPDKSETIIGSDSKSKPGELFTLDLIYNLTQVHHRRNKRMFDIVISLGVLIFFWVLMWLVSGRKMVLNGVFVLLGLKTWVGFGIRDIKWPNLKTSIFNAGKQFKGTEFEYDAKMVYVRDYNVMMDLKIVWNELCIVNHQPQE
ncbi:MAG: glycosyltransferase [Flavobacteriaceae bacterium]|nr:glycosyltransferase [Flavobacteriaceae bacterium]